MNRWVWWVSLNFIRGRKGGRGSWVFVSAVLLIAMGVTTLNTILAVMNGLQMNSITSIVEIGSFHVRWVPDESQGNIESAISILDDSPDSILAVPYRQGQTVLGGADGQIVGSLVRGVPSDIYERDEGLRRNLKIVSGSFDIRNGTVVVGQAMARQLGVREGDQMKFLSLSSNGLSSRVIEVTVTGLFDCGYKDYERGLVFVSLDTAKEILGDAGMEVGVKLHQSQMDRDFIKGFANDAVLSGGTLVSWRQSNRAYFGALKNEKNMMLILVALIFVVVAVNIDQALRRMVTERIEDIAILKAIGSSPGSIRKIFLLNGFIIGGLGGMIGSVLGTAIGENMTWIIETIRTLRRINPFSQSPYYYRSLDLWFESSTVMIKDVLVILFMAVTLNFLAAIRASSMAAGAKPAEVLRSE